VRVNVFSRPLQGMQIARQTSRKFDNGKSQSQRTRFNIQIISCMGRDEVIKI